MQAYRKFWAKVFALSQAELGLRKLSTTVTGPYVEKYGKRFIFLFEDLATKKRVIAGSPQREGSLRWSLVCRMKLNFDDLDYGLPRRSAFRSALLPDKNVRIARLTRRQIRAVHSFRRQCSARDWDTLDLTFKNEYVLGLFEGKKILGIARYAGIRNQPQLADITVVLLRRARGHGYSTPLVSALMEKILARGLLPKYRVGRNNHQSRAIAEKLGLRPLFSLRTFALPPWG
jgi:RimJ/RimL family protein N-acetyltransferase